MNSIIIHTDGSCEMQTRLGGWAAVLQYGEHQRVLQGNASERAVNQPSNQPATSGIHVQKT